MVHSTVVEVEDVIEDRLVKALGNPVRLRILEALVLNRDGLSLYKLSRVTGSSKTVVKRHVWKLVDAGLVRKKLYGRIQVFRFNEKNEAAEALAEFLLKLGGEGWCFGSPRVAP